MRIIRDHQIPAEICDLIQDAKKYVVMVTPYVDLWTRLTDSIEVAIRNKVFIQLHYRINKGKSEVKEKTLKELEGLGVKINGIELLHAKLYLSDSSAIMTSMNLYQHSSEKSKEVGLWTDKSSLLKEYKTYIETHLTSQPILPKKSLLQRGMELLKDDEPTPQPDFQRTESKKDGHCIRCSTSITYNVDRPYCLKHFKSWNSFKNDDYEEKYCHQCSKSHKTSKKRPRCLSCFKS